MKHNTTSPYFSYRASGKYKLNLSDIKLDYNTKIGGFTYLENTSFKTVLNKLIESVNNTSITSITSINNQTGLSYTLQLNDSNKLIEMENAAANTVTVPADANVNFSIGTSIDITQKGAGVTSIAPAAGVTINSIGGLRDISDRHALVALIKTGANEWLLIGSLA